MKLYTAEEAAEAFRLSKWTVWKYGREGKLRTKHFGRTVRYDLEGGNDVSGKSRLFDNSDIPDPRGRRESAGDILRGRDRRGHDQVRTD